MTGVDLVLALIFAVSILVGVMRGFIKEALSIISWIMAIWLGLTFCHEAGELLGRYVKIPAESFRTWAGFAAVFVGTLFVFSIINFMLTKLLVRGPIKGTDRVLGIGFGFARAIAIVVALIIVGRGMGMSTADWWSNSKGLKQLAPVADYVEELLPTRLQSTVLPDSVLPEGNEDNASS